MKKIVILAVLILVMSLIFVSCKKQEQTQSNKDNDSDNTGNTINDDPNNSTDGGNTDVGAGDDSNQDDGNTNNNVNIEFIVPHVMLYDTANEYIIKPAFDKISALMQEKCGDFDSSVLDYPRIIPTSYNVAEQEVYNEDKLYNFIKVHRVLEAYEEYARIVLGKTDEGYIAICSLIDSVDRIFSQYNLLRAEDATLLPIYMEKIKALQEGHDIIVFRDIFLGELPETLLVNLENAIKAVNPNYDVELLVLHEKECGYTRPMYSEQ